MKSKLMTLMFLVFVSHSSLACRCEGLSPKEVVDTSKALMIVYVEQTKVKNIPDEIYGTGGELELLEAKFKTLEVIKAAREPIDVIRSIGSCGMPIIAGKKYLVSIPTSGPIENLVSVCTGSFQIWESDKKKIERLRHLVHNKPIK